MKKTKKNLKMKMKNAKKVDVRYKKAILNEWHKNVFLVLPSLYVEVSGEKCPLCEYERIHVGVKAYPPGNKRSRKAP